MIRVCTLACLLAAALAFEAMPAAYWQNLAHGINARSLYKPGRQPAWSATLRSRNCTFPRFSTPFASMVTYGPAGVNPVDGSIVVGLLCGDATGGNIAPYLWVTSQKTAQQRLIQVYATDCGATLREGDAFEGYLNFLPDGGVIFGLCGSVWVLPLNSNTVRDIGNYGYSPSILSLINSDPPQLIIAGGRLDRWWEDWGACAVNVTGMTSQTISMDGAVGITDTTIMFSPDGKTMYNGHFDRWAPGSQYGLQYWKTPFTATSEPYGLVPQCSNTRPWTFASDSEGSVYSSWCSSMLVKIDKSFNQVWATACPANATCSGAQQQLFMSDDEKYIYVGSSATDYYNPGNYFIIDAKTGAIVKNFNLSGLAQEGQSCATIYGPFASRWPLPLHRKTRAVFQCTLNDNTTTIYSFDPFKANGGLKKYNTVNGFAPILLTDTSDNIYSIGLKGLKAFVQRYPA